jgi:hypothetical protein
MKDTLGKGIGFFKKFNFNDTTTDAPTAVKDDGGRIAALRLAHEQDETTFVMTDEHIPCAQEHHSLPNAEYDMEVNRSMLEKLCMFEREVDLRDVEARR